MSLLVVGALHWDVVVRANRLPRLDETLRGRDVAYQLGGKGGNQAIAAARAGGEVAFAGRIGSDDAGVSMRRQLVKENVDVSLLQQGPGASGMSVAVVTAEGEYGAVIVSAENHAFDFDQITLPQACEFVVLQNEMMPEVLPAYAAAARAAGARLIWNAAPANGIRGSDLAQVDCLIVNRVEAADILEKSPNSDPLEAVQRLYELAPHAEVILTLGGDGVAFSAPGQAPTHQPAEDVVVHSTHGAGDVFVGTYAASRLRGACLDKAVSEAQAASARHVSQRR